MKSQLPNNQPVDTHGLSVCLGELRELLTRDHSTSELQSAFDDVSQSADAILAEHGGMVDELLCVYEQLGIVFEVTRKLPEVRDEQEVIRLFSESLSKTFSESDIAIVRWDGSSRWMLVEDGLAVPDWLTKVLERSKKSRSVVVEPVPEGEVLDCYREVLVAPMYCGDSFVCAILLGRHPDLREFRAGDVLLMESLTTFCGDLIRNHHLVRELRRASISMVRSLVSAVDQKDPYTSGHSVRVGYFATMLAEEVGIRGEELQMLQWSALLHDVGKIGIRDEVLNKEGKLTPEEFDHIKEHPVRSYHVVKDVPQLQAAVKGALHHHERWDGSGYPEGLAGEEIPLQARIIQIADIFDALTSDRSYRAAYSWQQALEILAQEAGTHVDARLQETFDRLIRQSMDDDRADWDALVKRAERFAADPADLDAWAHGG
ncbi:MAG: HD-GYP domain-containing protein [Phycisphaerales bacterium]|nr:MAG: HD-GYP domain-containing protein [Phycisphaerales bacterium]